MGIEDRIRDIEEELKKTQYNKATEHHVGLLKAKMARLELEAESHKKGGGTGFAIPKTGDATVALVGFPNVGKSSLLSVLTNKQSEIGNFAFTTLRVIPGTMDYEGAQIQILDLPGIIENAAVGSGRGREVLSIVRGADLIVIVTDVNVGGIDKIVNELHKGGIVVNRRRKNISFKRTNSGGIRVHKPRKVEIDDVEIRDILKEFKITNGELYIREKIDAEDLIDFLRGNTVYVPAIVAINKIDLPHSMDKIVKSVGEIGKIVEVSASKRIGMDRLKNEIYNSLELVRIYLREKSGEIDYARPLVLSRGAKVEDVGRKISREMVQSFRYAIISGPNRKMNEIRVGLDYEVMDMDVVTLISRN